MEQNWTAMEENADVPSKMEINAAFWRKVERSGESMEIGFRAIHAY